MGWLSLNSHPHALWYLTHPDPLTRVALAPTLWGVFLDGCFQQQPARLGALQRTLIILENHNTLNLGPGAPGGHPYIPGTEGTGASGGHPHILGNGMVRSFWRSSVYQDQPDHDPSIGETQIPHF